jgi:hypothetical protein
MESGVDTTSSTRHRKHKILALIAIAVSLAAIALVINEAAPQYVGVGSFSSFQTSTVTSHDSSAVSISASLNATVVGANQTIKVTVTDRNTLRLPNELPLSGNWRVQNLSLGPCYPYASYPFGIAVFQGRYVLSNISSAKTLVIYAPGIYNCPSEGIASSFGFEPLQNTSSYVNLQGYWTTGETPNQYGGFSQGVLHPFLPGEYTVAAGDEWGHVEILYFQVTGISLQGFSLCPSNCLYPSPYLTGEIYFGGPSPCKSLELSVNGTDEGSLGHGIGVADVVYLYKGSFQSPQVVAGDTYVIKFIAVFEDSSTATAMTTVIAE